MAGGLTWYLRLSGWVRRIQILSRRKWLAIKAMTFFMLMRLPASTHKSVEIARQVSIKTACACHGTLLQAPQWPARSRRAAPER